MHWYSPDGSPLYELEGANGKMRPTTLRDARKLDLVPSVTTIMSMLDKPALLYWMQNQLLDAAVKNPFNALDHTPENWRKEVLAQSRQKTKKAADNGTIIHDAIEHCLFGNKRRTKKTKHVVDAVEKFLNEHFNGVEWVAEESFSHSLGFGGCVDLHSKTHKIVLDFKTKEKDEYDIANLKAYDEHHMQTAAYAVGLFDDGWLSDDYSDCAKVKRYNLFVGYSLENSVFECTGLKLTESTDFEREWGMFDLLRQLWQLKNNYAPGAL